MMKTQSKALRLGHAAMLVLNIALFCTVCVLDYIYQTHHFSFTLKRLTSRLFASIGVLNLLWALYLRRKDIGVYALLSLGLIFAMLGDIAINGNFVRGASLFAVGHVLLATAYLLLQRLSKPDLLLIALPMAFSLGFLQFYPYLWFYPRELRYVCMGYGVVISVMLGKAVSNFLRRPTLFFGLLALGSALFFFSDFMLLLHWFVGRWRWTDNACMAAYYPAVALLGVAMYFHTREKA